MAALGKFESGEARYQCTTAVQLDAQQTPQSCTDVYALWFDKPAAAPKLADVTGLPAEGAAHPTYRGLFATGYSFAPSNNDGGCQYWQVSVEYGVFVPSDSALEESSGIGKYIPPINYGFDRQDVPLLRDAETGEDLLNSAGEPFNGVPTVGRGLLTIEFTRRESRKPETVIEAFSLTVNSKEITVLGYTIAPRCGLITITGSDPLADRKLPYEYHYAITIRHQKVKNLGDDTAEVDIGHDEAFLQLGYHFKKGGVLQRFMEVDDPTKPTPDMCKLDNNGGDNRGGDPVNKLVKAYPGTDWAGLNLPASRPSIPSGD